MSDVTTSERDAIMRRHERAMKLRADFFKQVTNPHICATGSAGHVFDNQFIHFQAMRIHHVEHFKPTLASFRYGLSLASLFVLFGYAIKTHRDIKESKFRTGQVAYKDRLFRFI